MANLRANRIVSTTGSNAITGSVEFDGTNDWLQISDSANLELGSSDFTIEGWVYIGNKDQNIGTIFIKRTIATNLYSPYAIAVQTGALKFWSSSNGSSWDISSASSFGTIVTGSWYHFAIVRSGSSFNGYLNGILGFSVTSSASLLDNSAPISIGAESDNSNDFIGFVSNLRVIKGTALYTSNFIPPTRKLTKLPGTVLLCCQDNESVTTEATGKTITANGDPTATRFTPQVGSDGSVEFAGPTTINTENYFYLPTGTTENRFPNFAGVDAASARGLFGGGTAPGADNRIDYVTISSTGNAIDFGDLTGTRFTLGACASAVRGVFAGGYTPGPSNTIDFVTISSTGNAQDFGDFIETEVRRVSGCSSSTRGIFGPYQAPAQVNTISYITIATQSIAIDFGDATQARYLTGSCSSTVRGVMAGGVTPSLSNVIDYITIATTSNALDFGDLTAARQGPPAGCSSSTRGLFGTGYEASAVNTIDYITIASTGNAQDFGDATVARNNTSAASSQTRGLFAGGNTVNTIDYVTIATTGNAIDFGDLTASRLSLAGCSNGHGGLG